MAIIPKLNKNLHPKDCDNMSLVDAHNIKLANDGSCFVTEESISKNDIIDKYLTYEYKNKNGFEIVGVIPCNKELVLIVVAGNDNTKAKIFRYHEGDDTTDQGVYPAYGNNDDIYLEYHGGEINGAYTYNVEGSLIVAIAEYRDDAINIPLRTINLGNINDSRIDNDKTLDDGHIAISPEVHLPNINNIKYVKGNAYKGWYYLFIRYKINNTDYTQWFNFGRPIYNDVINKTSIIKYAYSSKFKDEQSSVDDIKSIIIGDGSQLGMSTTSEYKAFDGYCVGCTDYISDNKDLCNETFSVDITNLDQSYSKYQIGIVCLSKSYSKAFATNDINIDISTFTFSSTVVKDYAISNLIIDYYNYFNVKNICAYNNRLYIGGYKEAVDGDDIQQKVNNINVSLVAKPFLDDTISYDMTINSRQSKENPAKYNQYSYINKVPLGEFLNIQSGVGITITGTVLAISKDHKTADTITNKTINEAIDNFYITLKYTKIGEVYTISYPNYIVIHYDNKGITQDAKYDFYQFEGKQTISFDTNNLLFNAIKRNPIDINLNDYVIDKPNVFNDVAKTFAKRKLTTTFIPGEIYNLFIHFVDKYGHATNGYKLSNKVKYIVDNKEVVPFKFIHEYKNNTGWHWDTYYAAVDINNNVLDENLRVNTQGINIYSTFANNTFSNKVETPDIKRIFIAKFTSFENNDTYKELKWYQLADGVGVNNFIPFINVNNDRLFKFPVELDVIFSIKLNNVTLPNNYVGYYISYEKFEPTKLITGVLVKADGKLVDYYNNIVLDNPNNKKSAFMYFHSNDFNIKDSIKLNYNLIAIEDNNKWHYANNQKMLYSYFQRNNNYEYCFDLNVTEQLDRHSNNEMNAVYAMPDYKLVVAGDFSNNRQGKGTALQIEDKYGLFDIYNTSATNKNHIKQYKVSLYNITRNLYTNTNKELIRCSNIIYPNISPTDIQIYANGIFTWDAVLVYDEHGLNFDTADNVAYYSNNKIRYYKDDLGWSAADNKADSKVLPFVRYFQYSLIDTYFHESKSFKNEPIKYSVIINEDTKKPENTTYAQGVMVTPKNSIDLFENKQLSINENNPKTYTNYRSTDININIFNKVIRRSNVISNESKANGWRRFPLEGYKIINENKGNITKIIGVGTIFLVHTEYSMFMFDIDNTLKTNDKNIQLESQDIFDVDYKEIVTSKNGYAGLKDSKAAIFDNFGYIFYCNADNRFYKFDGGKLNNIDEDIIQWLNMYKPNIVRFANDKLNNRILIRIIYDVLSQDKEYTISKSIVLSYNYGTNTFISLHDYYFDEAYNTEFELYMLCLHGNHPSCSFHQFVADKNNCCTFDNIINDLGNPTKVDASISIIYNDNYPIIKFVDFISYRLSKLNDYTTIDNISLPVEGTTNPYAGDRLIVFNDKTTTDLLNIAVDKETDKNIFGAYKKPYWHLGNWNFSYLRNHIAAYNKYGDGFGMTRLFGNYFIFKFMFKNNTESKRIEFEDLHVKTTNI